MFETTRLTLGDRQSDEARLPVPAPNGSLSLVEHAASPALTDSGDIRRRTMNESDPPLALSPDDTNHPSEPPLISDSDSRALQRLVSGAVPQDELPSAIETILSNVKAADIVRSLQRSDAQTFIDVMDEVRHHPIQLVRKLFINLCFNLLFPSIRRCITPISHHGSEGNV